MDGSLPFLDGPGATRRIRENGPGDQVKILALNGWGPKYHAAALAAGCDDCIEKPFDIDQLRRYLVPLFAFSSYAPKQTSNWVPIPATDRIRL
jgi:CheY-like chemotaxis protein